MTEKARSFDIVLRAGNRPIFFENFQETAFFSSG